MSASIKLSNPYSMWLGSDGNLLPHGYIYIGEPNKNGKFYPIHAYIDAELTIPATQPVIVTSGIARQNGIPIDIFTDRNASILVTDVNGVPVLYNSNYHYSTGPVTIGSVSSDNVYYSPDTGGYKYQTLEKKLLQSVSVFDFGAVGNGITDDTLAFTYAIGTKKAVTVGSGKFLITGQLHIDGNDVNLGGGTLLLSGQNSSIKISGGSLFNGVINSTGAETPPDLIWITPGSRASTRDILFENISGSTKVRTTLNMIRVDAFGAQDFVIKDILIKNSTLHNGNVVISSAELCGIRFVGNYEATGGYEPSSGSMDNIKAIGMRCSGFQTTSHYSTAIAFDLVGKNSKAVSFDVSVEDVYASAVVGPTVSVNQADGASIRGIKCLLSSGDVYTKPSGLVLHGNGWNVTDVSVVATGPQTSGVTITGSNNALNGFDATFNPGYASTGLNLAKSTGTMASSISIRDAAVGIDLTDCRSAYIDGAKIDSSRIRPLSVLSVNGINNTVSNINTTGCGIKLDGTGTVAASTAIINARIMGCTSERLSALTIGRHNALLRQIVAESSSRFVVMLCKLGKNNVVDLDHLTLVRSAGSTHAWETPHAIVSTSGSDPTSVILGGTFDILSYETPENGSFGANSLVVLENATVNLTDLNIYNRAPKNSEKDCDLLVNQTDGTSFINSISQRPLVTGGTITITSPKADQGSLCIQDIYLNTPTDVQLVAYVGTIWDYIRKRTSKYHTLNRPIVIRLASDPTVKSSPWKWNF